MYLPALLLLGVIVVLQRQRKEKVRFQACQPETPGNCHFFGSCILLYRIGAGALPRSAMDLHSPSRREPADDLQSILAGRAGRLSSLRRLSWTRTDGVTRMSNQFASSADLEEKKITFSQLSRSLLGLHCGGSGPTSRCDYRRRRCNDHSMLTATPIMAQGHQAGAEVTDNPTKYGSHHYHAGAFWVPLDIARGP